MKQGVRAILFRDNKLLVMERNNKGRHYFALVGGTIDPGETKEQALVRELQEETGMTVSVFRHVFTETLEPFGTQYIYLCEDPGGEVALHPDSIEANLNKIGDNTFSPTWLAMSDIPASSLVSPRIKEALLDAVKNTFPSHPTTL